MSIINTFDNKTKEILSPKNLVDEIENFPEVAILIFKERFFRLFTRRIWNENYRSC